MQLEPGLGGGKEDSCLYPREVGALEDCGGCPSGGPSRSRGRCRRFAKFQLKIPQVLPGARWQLCTHQVTLGNALLSLGPESGRTFVQDLIIPERHHSKQGQSYEPPKTNHLLLIRVSQFLKKGKFSKNSPLFIVEAVCLSRDRGVSQETLQAWWPPGGARATGFEAEPLFSSGDPQQGLELS